MTVLAGFKDDGSSTYANRRPLGPLDAVKNVSTPALASGTVTTATIHWDLGSGSSLRVYVYRPDGSLAAATNSIDYNSGAGFGNYTLTFPSSFTVTQGEDLRIYAIGDVGWDIGTDGAGSTSYREATNVSFSTPPATEPTVGAATALGNLLIALEGTETASGPTLTTVPSTAYDGQTLNITGTNLTGATADFGGETATVSVVSDTEINVTIAQGGLKFATHTLTVTTAGGSATSDIELIVEPGTGDYINVVDPNTTDTTAFAYQVEDSLSNPVVTDDQFQWRYTGLAGDVTAMTVGADTRPTSLDQEGDVDGRFWDATDSTWSAWYTFTAAVPDEVAPTVSSVGVPTAGSYKAGDTLSFTVNFSEVVTVTGTPQLPIIIGGVTRQADYASGSGSSALVFGYTVQAGENDADGIGVGSAIGLNGGTIVDQAATPNAANLTLNSVGSTAGVLVDTVKPVINPIGANPANVVVGGTYTDAGATATDNIDGSLGSVTGTGSVDTNTIGQYTITYPGAGAVDSAGNVAEDATRIVNVVAEDFWPFSKGIKYAATKNWTWGKRHPKTGMRVRVYK